MEMLNAATAQSNTTSLKEICPLCMDLYAKVAEQTCLICDAPACSSCVDYNDAEDGTVCFACGG